jgi:hypothetical protein
MARQRQQGEATMTTRQETMTARPGQSDQDTWTHQAADLDTVLRHYVADPTASWGLGTFGAVAEFHRTDDEPVSVTTGVTLQAVTARGALHIGSTQAVRAFAYELPGQAADSWSHVLTLCLPATSTAMHRRAVLTECGPDREALRSDDRAAVLFDLGLGTEQVDVCVRTADPEGIALLRAGLGRSVMAPDNPLMPAIVRLSPHRVFVCRFARIEVYQRIPGHGEKPPEGPHTHVLPDLLRHQRAHPATAPIPDGWVSCLSLYPANPVYDANGRGRPFDRTAHEAFQALLQRFGDAELVHLKQTVIEAVRAGRGPGSVPLPASRAGRATVRVALRQLAHTDGNCDTLVAWRRAFDRVEATAEER